MAPRPARISALILGIALSSLPATARSDCQTDQEQDRISDFVVVVGELDGSVYRVAQTFEVGLSGELGEIHVHGETMVGDLFFRTVVCGTAVAAES